MPPRSAGLAEEHGQELIPRGERQEESAAGAAPQPTPQASSSSGCNLTQMVSPLLGTMLLAGCAWTVIYMQPESCGPLPGASNRDLQHLIDWNCGRVSATIAEFDGFKQHLKASVVENWDERCGQAMEDCKNANNTNLSLHDRASLATKAWGDVLMRTRECCHVPGPPFCSSRKSSQFARLVAGLMIGLVPVAIAMLLPMCTDSVTAPDLFSLGRSGRMYDEEGRKPHPTQWDKEWAKGDDGCLLQGGGKRDADGRGELRNKLGELFKESQLYKVVEKYGGDKGLDTDTIISCFVDLWASYGFQKASVENQLVHFLSLWRTHVMLYMDGKMLNNSPAAGLARESLPVSLQNLHDSLLGGFKEWYQQAPVDGLTIGDADDKPQKRLREIVAYLLIWGEAGNLRFMPECLYFILKHLLKEEPHAEFRSRNYLVEVVRPIYNTIFYEFYAKVGLKSDEVGDDKKPLPLHQRGDDKKLLPLHQKHLMADCTNYDDWNELFNDPAQLRTQLKLGLSGGQEFTSYEDFPRVDWFGVLANPQKGVKTHREIHSWWGVYRSAHRVYFLHLALYLFLLWEVCSSDFRSSKNLLAGKTPRVCSSTVGLVVPINAVMVKLSRWFTYGNLLRARYGVCHFLGDFLECAAALITYAVVRYVDARGDSSLRQLIDIDWLWWAPAVHILLCFALGLSMLLYPNRNEDMVRGQTTDLSLDCGDIPKKGARYAFWLTLLVTKCYFAINTLKAIDSAMDDLKISRLGKEAMVELPYYALGPIWDKDIIQWATLWGTGFLCFLADTQFWFIVWCSLWGELISVFAQRQAFDFFRRCRSFKDSLSRMPTLFKENVLKDNNPEAERKFPALWNLILRYMLYEDKLNRGDAVNLMYGQEQEQMSHIAQPELGDHQLMTYAHPRKPKIMTRANFCDHIVRESIACDSSWPRNRDVQWRIMTFARNMTYIMPKPFKAPFIPGFTVLVPHFMEDILCSKASLTETSSEEMLKRIDWLSIHYQAEFNAFRERMRETKANFDDYSTEWDKWEGKRDQWNDLKEFASMRSQVLLRTVAGLMYYLDALKIRYQLQKWEVRAYQEGGFDDDLFRWDPSDVFTCMIAMQQYAFFNEDVSFKQEFLADTNVMLARYKKSFQIAYIGYKDKGPRAGQDCVCEDQLRRYYSCLIQKVNVQEGDKSRQRPYWEIELPGFPIVGDGKGDNQNHAIVFTRGSIIQTCDMNQGAYLEQMLLLPNVLGEFRGDNGILQPRIVGFPEHITSNIGSMGDFAAAAETAFGTILQRVYAFLGGRMHYGHPDMMNKEHMMRQGGVSKAIKTLNLSEDIFAGMDFTLRGKGKIKHVEYFYVSKGRDLGFGTVLTFFAKLASGTGEQVLTRQMTRLGQLLGLTEFLTFYYGHFGFYFNQFLMTKSTQLLLFVWMVVVLDDPEDHFNSMGAAARTSTGAAAIATMLGTQYSYLMIMFMIAGTAPYEIQTISLSNFLEAVKSLFAQLFTGSPIYFIFQSKIIGHYLVNELTRGGAGYAATGRGLPIDRRQFIGGTGAAWKEDMKLLFEAGSEDAVVCLPVAELIDTVPPISNRRKVDHDVPYRTTNNKMPIRKRMQVGRGMRRRTMYYEQTMVKKDTEVTTGGMLDGGTEYIEATIKRTNIPCIQSEGGIYNDWVWKAFADGFLLVVGLVVVTLGGGFDIDTSVLWWMIALSFTITSWIFAPFIFNPYQWRWQFIRQDQKLWRSFFFHGEHWIMWYEKEFMGTKVIEYPDELSDSNEKRQSQKEAAARSWNAELGKKLKEKEGVKPGQTFFVTTRQGTNVDVRMDADTDVLQCGEGQLQLNGSDMPIKCWIDQANQTYRSDPLSVLAQCVFVGTWYTILNLKVHFLTVIYPGDFGVFIHVFKTMAPPVVLSGAFFFLTQPLRRPTSYLHPKYSFFLVLLLNFIEAAWGLWEVYQIGWMKCCLTGLILKLTFLSLIITVLETLFFMKRLDCIPDWVRMSLKSWLYGHRMLLDFLMSGSQLFVLSCFGFLSLIRSCFCLECAFSDWLNFRTFIPPLAEPEAEEEGGCCC